MEITIDTKNKTIKVNSNINLDELTKELKKLLGESYKEYTLQAKEIVVWPNTNTIYVDRYINVHPTTIPWIQPSLPPYHITCSSETNTL